MSLPGADGVMAATYKLVQQAMSGQWHDVPRTLAERRVLLDELSANASPQDQQWLSALKQAMMESDAAVAKMTAGASGADAARATLIAATQEASAPSAVDCVSTVMDMIVKSR